MTYHEMMTTPHSHARKRTLDLYLRVAGRLPSRGFTEGKPGEAGGVSVRCRSSDLDMLLEMPGDGEGLGWESGFGARRRFMCGNCREERIMLEVRA